MYPITSVQFYLYIKYRGGKKNDEYNFLLHCQYCVCVVHDDQFVILLYKYVGFKSSNCSPSYHPDI